MLGELAGDGVVEGSRVGDLVGEEGERNLVDAGRSSTHRADQAVAGLGEGLVAVGGAGLVGGGELGGGEDRLAAHDAGEQGAAGQANLTCGQGGDRGDRVGHVLAACAVAAGGGLHQGALAVLQG